LQSFAKVQRAAFLASNALIISRPATKLFRPPWKNMMEIV